jgi:ATP:corrinoid adenosyltransferase
MENTPPGGGCWRGLPAILAVVLIIAACAGMPWYYFVTDYQYVEGTVRELQDSAVLAVQILVAGLAALVLVAAGAGAMGVLGSFTRWASPRARDAATQIELARAQHQVLPDGLSSMTTTINHHYPRGRELAALEAPGQQTVIDSGLAPPALPAPLPHEDESFRPSLSRIAQLVDRRDIAPGSDRILVGYAGQQPLHIRVAEWGLAVVAGQSGKGKSSLAQLIIAQAALAGWTIIVCDPVYQREERSLLKHYLGGMSGAIWKQAVTPEEIAHGVGLAMKIANRRLTMGETGPRVLLVVDEFSSVARRKMLSAEQMEELFLTATKAAAVGVHTLLIAHDLSGSWFGGQSARRGRDQATHRLICNMATQAAASILPNQAYAQQVAVLPVGQALFFDGWNEPALLSFPRLTAEDVGWAAQGQPPKPYAPWLPVPPATPRPAGLAPTEPIGRAAPVTPLPPLRSAPPTTVLDPTATEAVLDVLSGEQGELDAESIARRAQLAEGTVRNALAKLRAEGYISHRRQGRQFVYSILRRPPTA